MSTPTPPPGQVHELAERAVDFVRRAIGMTLDYTPETLSVLDHYLGTVPRDRAEVVELAAVTTGAYFGEVVRKVLGGEWSQDATGEWRLVLEVGIRFSPAGMAAEAILKDDAEGRGAWEVPAAERAAVEEALADRQVSEDEYFSLCGRLETFQQVTDIITAARTGIPTA